jgi:hypothetical protein
MIRSSLPTALACLTLFAVPLSAADLAQIDRTIAREPAYKSHPKYCLLVFGPEAKARAWLVLDGDTLYVDRNGNGDLTEEGGRVTVRKDDGGGDGNLTFEAGDIRVGGRVHRNLHVNVRKLETLANRDPETKEYLARNPQARGYALALDVETPGRKGVGPGGRVEQLVNLSDVNGFLAFADDPRQAPVIHFGGPLQATLFGRHRLTVGREADLVLGVGAPGLGAGTTAYVAYEGLIPETAHPRAEIVYPPRRPGEEPVRELYELKHRC